MSYTSSGDGATVKTPADLATRWAATLGVELKPNGSKLDLAGLSRVPKDVRGQFIELVKVAKPWILAAHNPVDVVGADLDVPVLDYHPSMGRLTFDPPRQVKMPYRSPSFVGGVYGNVVEVRPDGFKCRFLRTDPVEDVPTLKAEDTEREEIWWL
jgi:hypothetical protein